MYINLKMSYNLLIYRLTKMLKVARSPLPAYAIIEHRNSEGVLLYRNAAALLDLGEEHILKGWFQADATAIPSNFIVDLAVEASFVETAVLGDATLVAGNGYAAVTVAADGTDWTATHTGDPWVVTSKNCVFTCGGTGQVWTIGSSVLLCATLNSVKTLIAYAALTAPRTLYSGDTLTTSLVMSLE
jgi:hypothetical protein